MPDDTINSTDKQALFSMPPDASDSVQSQTAKFGLLDQAAIRTALNQHTTQVYAYDNHTAVTLQVPGFSNNSADTSSQCMIYDQAHYSTQTFDGYDYDFGWTQRLVIKITKRGAKLSLTVPSAVAASCDMGDSTAVVQYVVRGLSGPYKDLTGDAANFGVDQFAQYRIKMQSLFDDLDNGKMSIVPVVIARHKNQEPQQIDRQDLYRGYAYRLCGVAGLLEDRTIDELFNYMTTKGKDLSGAPQVIADLNYFRQCIETAFADYGMSKDQRLSSMSKPDQASLKGKIVGDLDGFKAIRESF